MANTLYIVQGRPAHQDRLVEVGYYTARNEIGAIAQAALQTRADGENFVELVATKMQKVNEEI
jgi:hypothetical protein